MRAFWEKYRIFYRSVDTDENGEEKKGVTGFIFNASEFNEIKDSESLKIAVKPVRL